MSPSIDGESCSGRSSTTAGCSITDSSVFSSGEPRSSATGVSIEALFATGGSSPTGADSVRSVSSLISTSKGFLKLGSSMSFVTSTSGWVSSAVTCSSATSSVEVSPRASSGLTSVCTESSVGGWDPSSMVFSSMPSSTISSGEAGCSSKSSLFVSTTCSGSSELASV